MELAGYRGLEAMLKDPTFASPDPSRAAVTFPGSRPSSASRNEARLDEIAEFLRQPSWLTIPPYMGKFFIRQLPEVFKPTSPGGFMNPPGIYQTRTPNGLYFIPIYNPRSGNFYSSCRHRSPCPHPWPRRDPRSFSRKALHRLLTSPTRSAGQHSDNTFVEGWALYGEEMMDA